MPNSPTRLASVTGIVSNTAADPTSQEAIYTVGAQYDMVSDGVSGPVALTGTVDYDRYPAISGTITFPLYENVTGTVDINNRVVTGTGTNFTAELAVGDSLYYQGEARAIDSITSTTTLTVAAPFSATGTGVGVQRDNLSVVGVGTAFTTELKVGGLIYVMHNGVMVSRKVASIAGPTSLKLSSGWTFPVTAGGTAYRDGLTLVGTGTAFLSELQIGNYLVDPYRGGRTVKVTAIGSNSNAIVEEPFPTAVSTTCSLPSRRSTGGSHLIPWPVRA